MSNIQDVKVKGIPVTIDGTTHTLKFDLNAYAELEEIYGDVDTALDKAGNGSIKALRSLIWAGLLHEDATLTERQVGSWIGIEDLTQLTKDLTKAVAASKPDETATNPN